MQYSCLFFRLLVQNFWTADSDLSENINSRLTGILQHMYSPSTEADFLSYATNLILELTSKSTDFDREIFSTPLSDCKFLVSPLAWYNIECIFFDYNSWYFYYALIRELVVYSSTYVWNIPQTWRLSFGNMVWNFYCLICVFFDKKEVTLSIEKLRKFNWNCAWKW